MTKNIITPHTTMADTSNYIATTPIQNDKFRAYKPPEDHTMDVIIKSFNRPYYLDRCLYSIKQYVFGVRSIQVLDDGTPDIYLREIKRRHPEITIQRSARHATKSEYLASDASHSGRPPNEFSIIPWDMWRPAVQCASTYFLLMEDDQWCVKMTDLQAISMTMTAHECAIARLFRCPAFDRGTQSQISPELCAITPWYLKSQLSTQFLKAYLTNKHKLASILNRLRLSSKAWATDAYTLYVVCSIFDKDYWLDVTKGAGTGVNERMQLANALEWASGHPKSTFARTDTNHLSTTFRSSASSADLDGSVGFDMILFNKMMNEQWLAGNLDACVGMPGDIPASVILSILKEAREPLCTPENWSRWCDHFSESYRNLGCNID